jgi:hypothetical protein
MPKVFSVIAAMTLAGLVGACASASTDRQAAGPDSGGSPAPSCGEIFDGQCVWDISLDGPDDLTVENGSTVLFSHNQLPATSVDISVLCWSAGDDAYAGSCTDDGLQPPTELGISMTTVTQDGQQWPALAVKSMPIAEGDGEPLLALPATVLLGVNTGDQGILPVTVEVACCARLD